MQAYSDFFYLPGDGFLVSVLYSAIGETLYPLVVSPLCDMERFKNGFSTNFGQLPSVCRSVALLSGDVGIDVVTSGGHPSVLYLCSRISHTGSHVLMDNSFPFSHTCHRFELFKYVLNINLCALTANDPCSSDWSPNMVDSSEGKDRSNNSSHPRWYHHRRIGCCIFDICRSAFRTLGDKYGSI
jgi:hypothetical protein